MKLHIKCISVITLVLVLMFAGCQTAPTEPKRDAAADMQAINALRGQYTVAFNSSDAAATAALFTDDAMVMEANQVTIEGKQAIQGMFEAMFKDSAAKIALTPAETQVAGD
jgi:ketosteroid isomerase-like protein